MANNSDPKRYVKITDIPPSRKQELLNISANTGSSMSHLLKPVLIAFIETYPKYMREKRIED